MFNRSKAAKWLSSAAEMDTIVGLQFRCVMCSGILVMSESKHAKSGIILGAIAICLWSTTGALLCVGVSDIDVWQFLAVSCGLTGVFQLTVHGIRKREFASCFRLPWRLWAIILGCFVVYNMLLPHGLAMCRNDSEKCVVNLVNYLWPVLIVVFSVIWVPGTRLSSRLLVAIVLSMLGIGLAGYESISSASGGEITEDFSIVPYLMVAAAAVLWAVFSSLQARWRAWSGKFVTPPLAFISISAIAGIVCIARWQWQPLSLRQWMVICMLAFGPYGVGYLLWERALHRAPATLLGMMASATPVLSTFVLCLVQRHMPGKYIIAGALLISMAVLLTVIGKSRSGGVSGISGSPD